MQTLDKMKYLLILLALVAVISAYPNKRMEGVLTVLPEKPTDPAVYSSKDSPSVPVVKRDQTHSSEQQKDQAKVEESPKEDKHKELSQEQEEQDDQSKKEQNVQEHHDEIEKNEAIPDEPTIVVEKLEDKPEVKSSENEELVRTKRAPLILTKLFLAKGLGLGLG